MKILERFACSAFLVLPSIVFGQVDSLDASKADIPTPLFHNHLENAVYEYILEHDYKETSLDFLSFCPITIRVWSAKAGWDILVFDPTEDGAVVGTHYDFSGEFTELTEQELTILLESIILGEAEKQKSP